MSVLNYSKDDRPGYMDAYKFPFRRVGWGKNLALMAVCTIIPIVGPMALWGYMRIVFLDVYENPQADCPEFNFDQFGQYIGWGVWPFLAGMLMGMVVVPFMIIGQVGFIVMPAMGIKPAMMIGMAAVWFLLYMGVIALVTMLSFPVMLRALLMQDFSGAFNLRFLKDFIGKMWVDMLLKQLFMMATSVPIVMAGFICCIVGIYPAVMIVMLAGWYLQIQIYKDYVTRGGMQIPIKPMEGPGSIGAFEEGPEPGTI